MRSGILGGIFVAVALVLADPVAAQDGASGPAGNTVAGDGAVVGVTGGQGNSRTGSGAVPPPIAQPRAVARAPLPAATPAPVRPAVPRTTAVRPVVQSAPLARPAPHRAVARSRPAHDTRTISPRRPSSAAHLRRPTARHREKPMAGRVHARPARRVVKRDQDSVSSAVRETSHRPAARPPVALAPDGDKGANLMLPLLGLVALVGLGLAAEVRRILRVAPAA